MTLNTLGLLFHGAGQAGHVVLDEKRIHHRDGKRAEERARHERAAMVDVALDELVTMPTGTLFTSEDETNVRP